MNSAAPRLYDFRSREQKRQHLPLGAAMHQRHGMLNLPFAVQLSYGDIAFPGVWMPSGMSTVTVECATATGIALDDVFLELGE